MSKQPPQPGSGTTSQLSGLNLDDSLLDADDSQDFELRNENYNLKIRINNLEYENNKLSIEYENRIKELKQKNATLEFQLNNQKHDQEDRPAAKELQNQIDYLLEENEQLKKELQHIVDKNRLTPNFNSPEFAQDVATLNAYLERPEHFAQLEKAFEGVPLQDYQDLQKKYSGLEKDNSRLK
jgi:predicted RNase H-like nuclease (RuvC/YqgF family)